MTESVDVPHTILDMLGAPELPVKHGQSLRPYLEGKTPVAPRSHVFSEYLENEEAFIRTARYKLIYCSGKRERTDGYKTDRPTPGRYLRLYDLRSDPGELKDVAANQTGSCPRTAGHDVGPISIHASRSRPGTRRFDAGSTGLVFATEGRGRQGCGVTG